MKTPSMPLQGVFNSMQACVVLQLCLSHVFSSVASETSRDYYDILNIESTASDSQIKKAFRKLAVKYHPDKNKGDDAEKNFREITEAYKVLSDKEKRRLYDSVGHEAFLKDEGDFFNPEDSHDFDFDFSFADFFHDFEESPFMEEHIFHWGVHQDVEDEGSPYEHYVFEDSGFSFYFGDEMEEE